VAGWQLLPSVLDRLRIYFPGLLGNSTTALVVLERSVIPFLFLAGLVWSMLRRPQWPVHRNPILRV
jgi:hypothetical protein